MSARVEPSLLNEVQQAAAAAGVTSSEWVRQAVMFRLADDSLLTEVKN